MKRITFTVLGCLLVSTALVYGQKKEFKREVTKEFSVSANPTLRIEHKYGNIHMVEGTDNKIIFQIEIIGKGKTEALAKEYAETISIDFSQSGGRVSAKTVLGSINCNDCGRTAN